MGGKMIDGKSLQITPPPNPLPQGEGGIVGKCVVVILCGGGGARLWPLSTPETPKQFSPIFSDLSLLQQTILRFRDRGFPIILVCGENHAKLAEEQVQAVGVHDYFLLTEKEPRDSAPALALAAEFALKKWGECNLLVATSDHIIYGEEEFFEKILQANEFANREQKFVLFSVFPNRPETGYGYIGLTCHSSEGWNLCHAEEKNADKLLGMDTALQRYDRNYPVKIAEFIEKPNAEIENKLIAKGYLWNAGIFLLPAKVYLQELEKYQPAIYHAVKSGDFLSSPSLSIDYAVMQQTDKAFAISLEGVKWRYVGGWSAVLEEAKKDSNNNAIKGEVLADDCKNSLFISGKGKIIASGLEDYIVVKNGDDVLILPKEEARNLKDWLAKFSTP